MSDQEWFTAGQASVLAGIGYPQLDYLGRKNLLVPAVPASGKGSDRRYSLGDVFLLKVVQRLRSFGLDWEDTLPWIQWLRHSDQPGSGVEAHDLQFLVSCDGNTATPATAEMLHELLDKEPAACWIILNVRHILTELRQQVAELRNGRLT